jgi:hypothetical protein
MFRSIFAAGMILSTAFPGAALAASQIMGLVATADPTPMQCAGGDCTALLSSFCLQEKRLPPDFDSAYRPARHGQVSLIVTMADGTVSRFDAHGLVGFRTRYGYTAVEARLALDRLPTRSPVSLALEVGERSALLPLEISGDPDPLSEEEIEIATGPWRLAAQDILEGDGKRAASVRLAMRLINALPLTGDIAAGERESLWRRVAGEAPDLAQRTFDACIRAVDQAVGYPLRKCLEERHEKFQVENTREFWRSLGGS